MNDGDDDMTEATQPSTWPQRPDGTNKTVGEMTAPERSAVIAASRKRKITGRSALRVDDVTRPE